MLADTRMAYAFARDDALPFSRYDGITAFHTPASMSSSIFFFSLTLTFFHPKKLLLPHKPHHSNPPTRRLAHRPPLLPSKPPCPRQHPNRNRNLQHHSPSARSQLHRRHHRSSSLRPPRPVSSRTVHARSVGRPRQRSRHNMGAFHQRHPLLPDRDPHHGSKHELRHCRSVPHCHLLAVMVVDWRREIVRIIPYSVFGLSFAMRVFRDLFSPSSSSLWSFSTNILEISKYTGPRTKDLVPEGESGNGGGTTNEYPDIGSSSSQTATV